LLPKGKRHPPLYGLWHRPQPTANSQHGISIKQQQKAKKKGIK